MSTDEHIIVLRETLRKMSRGKRCLNPKGIQSRLLRNTDFNSITVKQAMKALRDANEVSADGWDEYHGMPLTQLKLDLAPEIHPHHVLDWFEVVQQSRFDEEAKRYLSTPAVAEKFKDIPHESRVRVLDDLKEFRDLHRTLPPETTVFEASAKYIMGSSKFLGFMGGTLLNSIGISLDHLSNGPRYLAVAGPPTPEAVILVENPHSFEMAVVAATDCAWACTYGFGLALGKEERLGQMLVESLTTHIVSLKMLVRAGSPPTLHELLRHKKLFFWGDLDLAGMIIFTQLKNSFQHIRLSGLYVPMLHKLDEKGGHPYVRSVGKEGQKKPCKVNDPVVEKILSRCFERGLDQEAIGIDEIEKYASLEFDYFLEN